jgi:glycerophosphoryl diester phosphodiesterase
LTPEPLKEFIVIAHRGASGYLPEHTLEGAALAHAMGVDYIEQDVVLTRDDALIVLHDLYLDAVTDAERFPPLARGRHYAIDFRWPSAIARHERTTLTAAGFAGPFPLEGDFPYRRWKRNLLIRGLNR